MCVIRDILLLELMPLPRIDNYTVVRQRIYQTPLYCNYTICSQSLATPSLVAGERMYHESLLGR